MKKIFFSLCLLLSISAFAAVKGIYSYAAVTSGGSMANTWDYLYNSNNVMYNSQSGYWVTKATHSGSWYLATVVVADNYSDITNIPIVGAGTTDGILSSTVNTTMNGYPAKIFYFYSSTNTSGSYNSFYSYNNTVLKSMDRFLRYP